MAGRDLPTVETALCWAAKQFARVGCESPRLDAEILLSECLRVNRAYLIAHASDALLPGDWEQFQAWALRRERREPVAYITGHREFYGLDFTVTHAVLIPRPETEHLVEEALAFAHSCQPDGTGVSIADVGTGSGAIAVSLAVHLPRARICALDASPEALSVAWRNADRHGVADRVCLLQSDLLENLPWPADIIAANLPYVGDAEWADLAPEIRLYEPEMALRGGADGLDAIRRMLHQAPERLRPGGGALLEIGAGQGVQVRAIAAETFPGAAVRIVQDYAGLDRVVVIQPVDATDEHR